jgi:Protein of unknown function (DUF4235)
VSKRQRAEDKRASKGKSSWRLIGAGSALVAGVAAARVLDLIWATATGRKPPSTPESPDIAQREAMVWAAVSGMAIGVAKTYATRRAARYWLRSTGELPPGMAEDASADDRQRIAS